MAHCEKCGHAGYAPADMFVEYDLFLGPCCATPNAPRVGVHVPGQPAQVINLPPAGDVEYGMEVSNKVGVRAYVNYSGLMVQFEKTPKEIRDWALKNGLVESKKAIR